MLVHGSKVAIFSIVQGVVDQASRFVLLSCRRTHDVYNGRELSVGSCNGIDCGEMSVHVEVRKSRTSNLLALSSPTPKVVISAPMPLIRAYPSAA